MTLEEIRRIINEIHERYKIRFSEIQEKREDGHIKMILVTLKFMVARNPDGVARRQTPGHSTGQEKST